MSATPDTDAAVQNGYRFTTDAGVREYVPAEFARQLERERDAAEADNEKYAGQPGSFARCEQLERENAKLRAVRAAVIAFEGISEAELSLLSLDSVNTDFRRLLVALRETA